MVKAKETVVVSCEACEARVSGAIEGSYTTFNEGGGFSIRYALVKCPSCSLPSLVSQDDEDARYAHSPETWENAVRMFPEEEKKRLGHSVPEAIRKAFAEAFSCYTANAYTACAIMCRKVLEGICESHKAKGSNLAQRLKWLSDKGELDKRLYDWITTLRVVGNEAAHDVDVTVSREDAGDLLDLSEAVAEYLYTFKEKFDSFEKRRKNRSAKEINEV